MVYRIKRTGIVRRNLGTLNFIIWGICLFIKAGLMEDFILFLLGLIATGMAIGPLFIALIADMREKKDNQ
jgi:fucose permease